MIKRKNYYLDFFYILTLAWALNNVCWASSNQLERSAVEDVKVEDALSDHSDAGKYDDSDGISSSDTEASDGSADNKYKDEDYNNPSWCMLYLEQNEFLQFRLQPDHLIIDWRMVQRDEENRKIHPRRPLNALVFERLFFGLGAFKPNFLNTTSDVEYLFALWNYYAPQEHKHFLKALFLQKCTGFYALQFRQAFIAKEEKNQKGLEWCKANLPHDNTLALPDLSLLYSISMNWEVVAAREEKKEKENRMNLNSVIFEALCSKQCAFFRSAYLPSDDIREKACQYFYDLLCDKTKNMETTQANMCFALFCKKIIQDRHNAFRFALRKKWMKKLYHSLKIQDCPLETTNFLAALDIDWHKALGKVAGNLPKKKLDDVTWQALFTEHSQFKNGRLLFGALPEEEQKRCMDYVETLFLNTTKIQHNKLEDWVLEATNEEEALENLYVFIGKHGRMESDVLSPLLQKACLVRSLEFLEQNEEEELESNKAFLMAMVDWVDVVDRVLHLSSIENVIADRLCEEDNKLNVDAIHALIKDLPKVTNYLFRALDNFMADDETSHVKDAEEVEVLLKRFLQNVQGPKFGKQFLETFHKIAKQEGFRWCWEELQHEIILPETTKTHLQKTEILWYTLAWQEHFKEENAQRSFEKLIFDEVVVANHRVSYLADPATLACLASVYTRCESVLDISQKWHVLQKIMKANTRPYRLYHKVVFGGVALLAIAAVTVVSKSKQALKVKQPDVLQEVSRHMDQDHNANKEAMNRGIKENGGQSWLVVYLLGALLSTLGFFFYYSRLQKK